MNEADEKALLEQLKKVDDDHPRTAYGFRLGFQSAVAHRDAQPAGAVNEQMLAALKELMYARTDKAEGMADAAIAAAEAEKALAAERAPLVRITPEKIREIYASGPMTYIEFAKAIMDAMERVNK